MPHVRKIIFPLLLMIAIAVMYVYVMLQIAGNAAEKSLQSVSRTEVSDTQISIEEAVEENEFNPSLYGPEAWTKLAKSGELAAMCNVYSDVITDEIKTEEISLDINNPDPLLLSFDYLDCPTHQINFSIENGSLMRETIPHDTSEMTEKYRIADYWLLDEDESTREFLEQKILQLPTSNQQKYCVVSNASTNELDFWQNIHVVNDEIFVVHVSEDMPEEIYNELQEEYHNFCDPLGSGWYYNFYRRIDNVLFRIHVGHDTPNFSPASFRLTQ